MAEERRGVAGVREPAALASPSNRLVGERLRETIASTAGPARTHRELALRLHEQGLHMEGREYRLTARPLIVEREEFAGLADRCQRLHRLLERCIELYAAHPELRRLFDDYAAYEAAILDYPPHEPRIQSCRLDCAWRGGAEFTVMEANTACPSGVVQIPMAVAEWLRTDWAAALLEGMAQVPIELVRDPHAFARSLVASAREAGHDVRAAAIVNLGGVYTNEVEWMVRRFRELGLEAQLVDARSVRRNHGRVLCAGQAYELLYNKLDPLALLAEPAAADYLHAFREHRASIVNPLVAQTVTEDKAILALLSDPVHAPMFTDAERELIASHVPWTRLLRPCRTTDPDGATVDLFDYAARRRDRLVLKPANLTRGTEVLVGPFTSEEAWQRGLSEARHARTVVQEYAPLPMMEVPTEDGGLEEVFVDLSCHLFAGRLVGFFSRASRRPVVNMGAGGACMPVVQVEGGARDGHA